MIKKKLTKLTALMIFGILAGTSFPFKVSAFLGIEFGWSWIVNNIFAPIANLWLAILGSLVWLTGLLFDLSIYISVTDFKSFVETSGMAQVGWSLFRDMANISFIFIILYIAISTILQLGSDKRLLAKVVIIALLINFSGVITKLVIDVSNVVANQFYSQLNTDNTPFSENNISGKLVAGFKFGQQFKEPTPSTFKESSGKKEGLFDIVVGVIGKSILILITAFLLLAGAVMFFLRTFTLIFLIIVSPLAFMAYAFPGLGSYFNKWWSKLFSQAFFAPLFLAFIFITIKAIKVSGSVVVPSGSGTSWTDTAQNLMGTMVNFLIVGGMMLGSLVMASKLGAAGASQMTKLGHNLRGRAQSFAGRGTIGKASRRIAESDAMKWAERKSPRIGGTLRNIAEYGAKQKFGGKTSYEDEIKQRVKASEKFKDNPEQQAEYLKKLGPGLLSRTLQRVPVVGRAISATSQPQEAIYDKLKPEQKVELERVLGEQSSKAWGSVKTVEDLDKERSAIHTKYQTIRDWHQTTPDALKLTADNWEKRQEYNRYQKELEQVNKQYEGAPTEREPQKVLTARLRVAQPFQKRFNIIRDLRDNLSEADKGKFKSVIQKKGRDKKIKDLEAIPENLRTETQRKDLIRLTQERKEDKDREALAGAAREAAKEGVKEGGGESGGGGDKKKD